jgi:hypothetical protein
MHKLDHALQQSPPPWSCVAPRSGVLPRAAASVSDAARRRLAPPRHLLTGLSATRLRVYLVVHVWPPCNHHWLLACTSTSHAVVLVERQPPAAALLERVQRRQAVAGRQRDRAAAAASAARGLRVAQRRARPRGGGAARAEAGGRWRLGHEGGRRRGPKGCGGSSVRQGGRSGAVCSRAGAGAQGARLSPRGRHAAGRGAAEPAAAAHGPSAAAAGEAGPRGHAALSDPCAGGEEQWVDRPPRAGTPSSLDTSALARVCVLALPGFTKHSTQGTRHAPVGAEPRYALTSSMRWFRSATTPLP